MVFDVHELLGVRNGVDVRIGNGVFGFLTSGPSRAAIKESVSFSSLLGQHSRRRYGHLPSAQLDMGAGVFLTALLALLSFLAPYPSEVSGEVTLKTTEHLTSLSLTVVDETSRYRRVVHGEIEFLILGSFISDIVLLSPNVVPRDLLVKFKTSSLHAKLEY